MQNPLRTWRKTEKLSLTQLGELFGVDRQTVYRWEKGEHLPRQKYWADIEKKTGIPASQLVVHVNQEEAAQ